MQISSLGGGFSMSSLQSMQQQMFQSADTDGDGSIKLDEFKNAKGPAGAPQVSSSFKESIFSLIDANGDGGIDQDEIKAARSAHGPSMSQDMMSMLISVQSGNCGPSGFDFGQYAASGSLAAGDVSSNTASQMVDELMKALDPQKQNDRGVTA